MRQGRLNGPRGAWSVSSAAQSRRLDRNSCGTAAILCFPSSRGSYFSSIGFPGMADEHKWTGSVPECPRHLARAVLDFRGPTRCPGPGSGKRYVKPAATHIRVGHAGRPWAAGLH